MYEQPYRYEDALQAFSVEKQLTIAHNAVLPLPLLRGRAGDTSSPGYPQLLWSLPGISMNFDVFRKEYSKLL